MTRRTAGLTGIPENRAGAERALAQRAATLNHGQTAGVVAAGRWSPWVAAAASGSRHSQSQTVIIVKTMIKTHLLFYFFLRTFRRLYRASQDLQDLQGFAEFFQSFTELDSTL